MYLLLKKQSITLVLFLALCFQKVSAQSLFLSGNDGVFVSTNETFSVVGGVKLVGTGNGKLSLPNESALSSLGSNSKRVLSTNANSSLELRNIGLNQPAIFNMDVLVSSNVNSVSLRIDNKNSASAYQVKVSNFDRANYTDIQNEWTVTRTASQSSDTHNLVFSWGNDLEPSLIANKRLYVFDNAINNWSQLSVNNISIDEVANTLTYTNYVGALNGTRFMIAESKSTGDLTIVASGGHAIGSTWTFNNGVITMLSNTAANINASVVQNYLTAGELFVEAGNIFVNGNLSISSSRKLNLIATGVITHNATVSSAGPIMEWSRKIQVLANISASNSRDIEFKTDTLSIGTNNTVSSTGQLLLSAQNVSSSIGLGGATGTLQLPASYFSTNFTDGFSNIQIGSSSQTGAISSNAFTLRDNMSLLTSGTLTLGGKPVLGTNNLTLGSTISTINVGSPANYFQTNNTGKVFRTIGNGISRLIPVGNASYNPVTITNNTGAADDFSARVIDSICVNGLTGSAVTSPRVNVTWDINKVNPNTGSGIDIQFGWNASQELGGVDSYQLYHYAVSDWDQAPGTSQSPVGSTSKTMLHEDYVGSLYPFVISKDSVPSSVSIAASTNPVCSGQEVTFTATPTNGGSAPSYAWMKNGTAISGATSATYTAFAGIDFVNGDIITCQMKASISVFVDSAIVSSNAINMIVNSSAPTNTPGTYVSNVVNHPDGTMREYTTSSCVGIGRTTDASGGNVPGNTTMTATVVSTMQSTNPDGWKYVRRSYTSTTASDGQRTLTFYFTQEDFNDYNANNYGSMDLPTSGNNSDPNKPYIRLITVTSNGYTVSASLGVNLTWNGTYWQLTKLVPSVNGATYYISTQSSCEGVLVNGLAAGNVSSTNATLTWTAISPNPSTGYYQFRYKPTASSTWIDGGTANYLATSKTFSTLSPGTQYEFQIRRVCSSDGFGAWSSSVILSTISSGCGSPMVFNAPTSTSSTVTLSWPAVTGAAWFQFQYKESSSGTWLSAGTLTGTGTTRTVSGLNPNTSYDFRGRTYCPNNAASAWSTTVTATTTGQSGCALPPVLTVASLTGTSATITWPVVQGAGWYEFRYKENSAGTWTSGGTASSTATSKIISGLTADANYIIQARTYCSNGTPSNWSSSLTFGTTGDEPCETAPVLTVASVSNTSATITWPAISGAAWYQFRYKASTSSTWISCGTLSGTGTTRVLSGLTANTQYDFQAKTFCPNGSPSSAWSTTLQFTTTGAAAIALAEGDGIESSEGQSTKEMAINEASGVAVNVFPNPTDDLVQVQVIIEQANETLLVRVFDMSGRLVQEAQTLTEGGLTTIPLSMGEMMTGMYNVELYQNGALIHRARVQKN